jgi:hypothetical protein
MQCPKCGKENPDDARFCSSCGTALTQTLAIDEDTIVQTSRLAIASCIVALVSVLVFYFVFYIARGDRGRNENLFILTVWLITSWLAVILGIISLIQIVLSAGRLVGTGFAIIGAVLPFSVYVMLMFIAFLRPVRMVGYAYRMTCGSNLSGIGKAMLMYANDYEDELPRAGGRSSVWGAAVNWDARDRSTAFRLSAKGTGGQATISSSLYLLVKYAEVPTKIFVCTHDKGTTAFKLTDYPKAAIAELIDAWDFGPNPAKHYSYSYHIPYGSYPLTTSSDPGMAVAADRNPWIDSPAARAKDFSLFKPDKPPWNGTTASAKYGNAVAHKEDGQNVLFMDAHVEFAKRSYCALDDDNIYTYLPGGLGEPQIGKPPVPFISQPGHKKDSFLVHDPPAGTGK